MKITTSWPALGLLIALAAVPCGLAAQEAPPQPVPAAQAEVATSETGPVAGAEPAPNAPASPAAATGATAADTAAKPAKAARAPPAGRARDRLELESTQITGNRELPKVLYIVPWKRSDLGDLPGRPLNSLLDEVLEPVDRDVFQRENRYYRALQPQSAPQAPPVAPE